MNFISKIRRAIFEDDGAVTVDWVVLTAAVVVLSIGAISALEGGITGMIADINTALSDNGATVAAETF